MVRAACAGKVVALLEDMQGLVAVQSEAVAVHEQRLKTLLADFKTSDTDLRAEFASFNSGRNEWAAIVAKSDLGPAGS